MFHYILALEYNEEQMLDDHYSAGLNQNANNSGTDTEEFHESENDKEAMTEQEKQPQGVKRKGKVSSPQEAQKALATLLLNGVLDLNELPAYLLKISQQQEETNKKRNKQVLSSSENN